MATRTSAKNQILDLLRADHAKVKKAFRQFERMDAEESPEECEALVSQTCAELTVHAEIEEELFYPALREALKEPDLIDEAEVEHMSAKALIAQLQQMTSADDKFAATFKVLGEYIKHHVKEEESEMFESIGRTGVDWDGLLEQMLERRAQLMVEMGLADSAEGEPEEAAEAPASARRGRSRREAETVE